MSDKNHPERDECGAMPFIESLYNVSEEVPEQDRCPNCGCTTFTCDHEDSCLVSCECPNVCDECGTEWRPSDE